MICPTGPAAAAGEEPSYSKVYRGLHLPSYLSSRLRHALGRDKSTRRQIPWSKVQDLLKAPTQGKLLRIEIGAATKPICPDFVQVDKYTSDFQMDKANATYWLKAWGYKPGDKIPKGVLMQTGGFLTDKDRLRRLAAQGATSAQELLKPYAVVTGKRGIVADARRIPLADRSASLIVSKNFPWFHRVGLMDRTVLGHPWYGRILSLVKGYLKEQHRLLAPGGKAVVLASTKEAPFRLMWSHIKLAERMGFSVELVRDRSRPVSGIVLTKLSHRASVTGNKRTGKPRRSWRFWRAR